MLLLNAGDHDTDTDPWPWGGEPIFRDGIYAGRVTTTAYGFSLNRHVCLGFVHDYDECGPEGCKFPPEGSVTNTITPDWVKVFNINHFILSMLNQTHITLIITSIITNCGCRPENLRSKLEGFDIQQMLD